MHSFLTPLSLSSPKGGLGSDEEMCVVYLAYYPRTPLSTCFSSPTVDQVARALGATGATWVAPG